MSSEHDPDHDALDAEADDDSFNDADDGGQLSDDSFNDEPQADEEEEEEDGRAPRAAISASTSSHSLAFDVGARKEYSILDESELRRSMDALTKDVATVLHVPQHLASMLLRTHNWNKEKFESPYFEDPDGLLTKCGLQFMAEDGADGKPSRVRDERDISTTSLPSATSLDRSKTAPSQSYDSSPSLSASASASAGASSVAAPSSAVFNCPVCYDDFPLDATVALGCGHRFCTGCWSNYLQTSVNDGRLCTVTRCAGFKCPILVPDNTFKKLTPPDVFARHQTYLVRSYVEDSRMMRWCPGQRCNLAVRVFSSAVMTVKCRCGQAFCFHCGEENHAPVSCVRLAEWNEKCKNESETAHWIIANTKKCPKCAVRIEKSQGCNHMTCRSCKYEWCWVCNDDWAQHGNHTGGYYKCNKWDPKAKASATTSAEEAKAELNRYLHYYQRFHNHDQSKRFAEKQRGQTDLRMAHLHARSGGEAAWIDFQFLAAATEQVRECRNVLKYTYVFAYYLPDGPEKTLFEYLQQQLESATEHLSELSELPPLDKLDRAQIVNYTRITGQFMQNLLHGVQTGLTPH